MLAIPCPRKSNHSHTGTLRRPYAKRQPRDCVPRLAANRSESARRSSLKRAPRAAATEDQPWTLSSHLPEGEGLTYCSSAAVESELAPLAAVRVAGAQVAGFRPRQPTENTARKPACIESRNLFRAGVDHAFFFFFLHAIDVGHEIGVDAGRARVGQNACLGDANQRLVLGPTFEPDRATRPDNGMIRDAYPRMPRWSFAAGPRMRRGCAPG